MLSAFQGQFSFETLDLRFFSFVFISHIGGENWPSGLLVTRVQAASTISWSLLT